MDNPNFLNPQSAQPAPQMPQQPMAESPQMPASTKRKMSPWFFIILAIALVVGALAWWYIATMAPKPLVDSSPKIDQEAREDKILNGEIQASDTGNLDMEFNDVDKDINSL